VSQTLSPLEPIRRVRLNKTAYSPDGDYMRLRLPALLLLVPALSAGTVLGTVVPATPAQASVAIDGPDVSAYQHPGGASINWGAVARSGREFAIVKATESTWYVNKYFRADYAGIRKAGMVRGSYHFARPSRPVGPSALAQSRFYVAHIGASDTTATLPPALDLEVTGGLSRTALITWAQDFLLDVRRLTGRTPMIYTYPWFWRYAVGDAAAFARYPLWMAAYRGTTPDAAATLWQYTAGATVSGIKGRVDMSRLLTDPAKWAALTDGTATAPWPDLAPGRPVHVVAAPGVGAVTVSWLPPDAGSAPVTGYTAAVAPADGSAPAHTVNVSAGRFSVRFTGLTPGRPYIYAVQARNSVGAGTAAAPAAQVVPQAATSVVLTGPGVLRYGAPGVYTATLTRADSGAPLAGVPVRFATRPHNGGAWTARGTLVTDATGTVTRLFTPAGNDDVRFSYGGAVGLAPAAAMRGVGVRPLVFVRLTATRVALKHTVWFVGHVTPVVAGMTVLRESYSGGRWHLDAVTHTNRNGNYRFPIRPTSRGIFHYRAVVVPSRSHLTGVSRTLTLRAG